MTIEQITRHIGAIHAAETVFISASAGFVTSAGTLISNSSIAQGYVYCYFDDVMTGDILHLRTRATQNVSVFSSTNSSHSFFRPEVLGTDGSTTKDYFYIVGDCESVCLSVYSSESSLSFEVMRNLMSQDIGEQKLLIKPLIREIGDISERNPCNLYTDFQDNRYIGLAGRVISENCYRVSRPITVSKGDIVYLKSKLTSNVTAIALVTDNLSDAYFPVVHGKDDITPSEYHYIVQEDGQIVVSYYIGSYQHYSYDIRILHSFLSEMLSNIDHYSGPTFTLPPNGNVITSSLFNNRQGGTFIIQYPYQIAENEILVIPENCTLVYRNGGAIFNGEVLFQNTMLRGCVNNDVIINSNSRFANKHLYASWFCKEQLYPTEATHNDRRDKLNQLIDCLCYQTVEIDQTFVLFPTPCVNDRYIYHYSLDGFLLKSNVSYHGTPLTKIILDNAHTAFSTRTYQFIDGNNSDPEERNTDPVCHVELSDLFFECTSRQLSGINPCNLSIINLGSVCDAKIYRCHFLNWRGTAVTLNYLPKKRENSFETDDHFVTIAKNVTIEACSFNHVADSLQPTLGNGITISHGKDVVIRKCEFRNLNTSWPGAIDIEGECPEAVFENITIENCYFENCKSLAAVNIASNLESPRMADEQQLVFKNIVIRNNRIVGVNRGISVINCYSREENDIEFRNNQYTDVKEVGIKLFKSNENTKVLIDNCLMEAAQSTSVVPKIQIAQFRAPNIVDCTFIGFSDL